MAAKTSDNISLSLYRDMNFRRCKRYYMEWWARRERSGLMWQKAGVRKL